MIRAVIFDLDGTLIDSERQGVEAAIEAFASWGHHVTPAHAESVVGKTWEKAMRELEAHYPLPRSFEECVKEAERFYREKIKGGVIEIAGAADAVRRLSQTHRLGLVSGSTHENIEFALSQLKVRDLIEVILGCESYSRSKPAPDGYLMAANLLCVQPSECLVFEDSVAGIESARLAGMKVVAIEAANWFGHDHSRAHARIRSWNELTSEWLRQNA